jgi:hypothetical protein
MCYLILTIDNFYQLQKKRKIKDRNFANGPYGNKIKLGKITNFCDLILKNLKSFFIMFFG